MDRQATARAYYDCLDGHDYERLADLLAAEFTHYRPDRTIEGRDRFVQFMRDERPMTDTNHPLDAVYTDGDEVAARGRLLDPDGDLLVSFVDVFAFDDGDVATLHTYTH